MHYEAGKPPWIESRLQDFFGTREGPTLAGGKAPLVLHLLAPNQRAVQVTTDLAGFWERHYPSIRRELRGATHATPGPRTHATPHHQRRGASSPAPDAMHLAPTSLLRGSLGLGRSRPQTDLACVAPRRPVPPYRAQLALLVAEAPAGDSWVHEVKYDGYRIGCAIEGGEVTLWSRRGKDWTAQFPEVAAAARRLKVRSALLDGEVAAVLPDGRTSFQALQNAFAGGRRDLVYFVFDLLHLDGEDLPERPLLERKATLARLVGEGTGGDPLRVALRWERP